MLNSLESIITSFFKKRAVLYTGKRHGLTFLRLLSYDRYNSNCHRRLVFNPACCVVTKNKWAEWPSVCSFLSSLIMYRVLYFWRSVLRRKGESCSGGEDIAREGCGYSHPLKCSCWKLMAFDMRIVCWVSPAMDVS